MGFCVIQFSQVIKHSYRLNRTLLFLRFIIMSRRTRDPPDTIVRVFPRCCVRQFVALHSATRDKYDAAFTFMSIGKSSATTRRKYANYMAQPVKLFLVHSDCAILIEQTPNDFFCFLTCHWYSAYLSLFLSTRARIHARTHNLLL